MKKWQQFFEFYIDSNIHVSVAGATFIIVSCQYYNGSDGATYAFFVFFSTLFSYNFIRIFEGKTTQEQLTSIFSKQALYVPWLMLISFAGMVYFVLFLSIRELVILAPAFLLTFGYVFPVVRWKKQWVSLRDYPSFKMLSVALAWAIVGVLFPLNKHLNDPVVWIQFFQRFLLIMALLIPFDIRDLSSDSSHLNTLPQWMGVSKSIKIGIGMLVLYFIGSVLLLFFTIHYLVSDIFILLLALLFLLNSKPNQSKYYASFWVESVPIFWLSFIVSIKVLLDYFNLSI